jgi:hypothetical protein
MRHLTSEMLKFLDMLSSKRARSCSQYSKTRNTLGGTEFLSMCCTPRWTRD